ncbi:MAG: response regulator transcription factor [Bacteroidales bacterium]|nr:response regulator transcription factor [Bacteroidales bacterium]
MKALIIEDEKMAQANLARLLKNSFPEMEIVAMIDSVRGAVEFLSARPKLDVIFMDVELSDGICFEIFRSVQISAPVIMTTAYDSYAVKAFEAGSIDYLLKPVDSDELLRAVGRARERLNASASIDKLLSVLGQDSKKYKEKSVVRCGDRIIPIQSSDIALFFSEDKANYLLTKNGERYLIESTIDSLESELDPSKFYRISRGCIVAFSAIKSVSRTSTGRLVVISQPASPVELTVSRGRVEGFIAWLE